MPPPPDDPSGPSLEMEPQLRPQHTQRLTLSGVMREIRAELAQARTETDTSLQAMLADIDAIRTETDIRFQAMLADTEAIRALALAQGERRTEDLRRMIHEEVADQMATFKTEVTAEITAEITALFAPVKDWMAQAEVHRQDDADVRAFVKAEQADRQRKQTLERAWRLREEAWRLRMDRTLAPVYPLLTGVLTGLFLLIIEGRASTTGAISGQSYYIGVAVLAVVMGVWTFYRGYLHPARSRPPAPPPSPEGSAPGEEHQQGGTRA